MSVLKNDIELPWQDHKRINYWIDERIWGHRIWDNQSPWLIFLELLGIAESANREGNLFDENGKYYPLIFNPYQRMMLRNILYNNQIMPFILDRYPDNSRAWEKWSEWMKSNARGVIERDFDYVGERFSDFGKFSKLIAMIRTATVESESNRRWSSRFIFPFGEDCLYEDVGISTQDKPTSEYINFGRTGELLYLMLSRSKSASELKQHFCKVVTNKNPWNSLVSQLQKTEQPNTSHRNSCYLPYKQHASFDRAGEDILHLFELGLPRFDGYPHVTLLAAMHVMLYQLEVAWQVAGGDRPVMICEIVAPRKTLVRELSIQSYQRNSQLSSIAVSKFVGDLVSTDEWNKAKAATDAFPQCKEILIREIAWPRDEGDYEGAHDPDLMVKHLRQSALSRHRQHAGNVHRAYGRSIGLISKRGTNKLRYAPNDSLLKALILANVHGRMEFKVFLKRLFDRYGIVLGEREAKIVMNDSDFDNKAFQSNSSRLEQRLSSLGMLKRLSDACAYVLNPYAEVSQ
ncbi:hypothetical protein [Mariniblastus fucicola]|uniref:Uncharacterized protein n=1 Tax=Mariniblastus fucicola TaxID=980251 RepID=A0A5B9PKC6_9BACT|nr:hypothetical protein [Mariniblastus fucicola]QEG25146.1 hypothetical protein MFFC18_50700 [Mariniblastus fucicola]